MGVIGFVFAFLSAGYFLGVWTGGLVFKQRQAAYEDAVPSAMWSVPVFVPDQKTSPPERHC